MLQQTCLLTENCSFHLTWTWWNVKYRNSYKNKSLQYIYLRKATCFFWSKEEQNMAFIFLFMYINVARLGTVQYIVQEVGMCGENSGFVCANFEPPPPVLANTPQSRVRSPNPSFAIYHLCCKYQMCCDQIFQRNVLQMINIALFMISRFESQFHMSIGRIYTGPQCVT